MEQFRAAGSQASRWREQFELSDQTVGSAQPKPVCWEGYGGESDRALRARPWGQSPGQYVREGGQKRSRHRGQGRFDVLLSSGLSVGRHVGAGRPPGYSSRRL